MVGGQTPRYLCWARESANFCHFTLQILAKRFRYAGSVSSPLDEAMATGGQGSALQEKRTRASSRIAPFLPLPWKKTTNYIVYFHSCCLVPTGPDLMALIEEQAKC